MSQVKRVLELTDGNSRMLRVVAPQNSTFVKFTIDEKNVTLDPAAQLELWRFLSDNKSPVILSDNRSPITSSGAGDVDVPLPEAFGDTKTVRSGTTRD